MDTVEEIQRRVEDALSKAKASKREDVRRQWLEIAEQWASLATARLMQREDEVNHEMMEYKDATTGAVGMSSEELRSERAVRFLENAENARARAKSASDPKVRSFSSARRRLGAARCARRLGRTAGLAQEGLTRAHPYSG